MNKKILLFGIFSVSCVLVCCKDDKNDFEFYGQKIDCSDVVSVINSDVMQRLKYIDQSGGARYFGAKLPPFSRYEHSIGVYAVLKKAKVSKNELVAGLLHDASHTVFSHVGDYIWTDDVNRYTNESYQDKIHLAYLQNGKLDEILKSIGMTLKDADAKNANYKALEQQLPDMCADRIQYNIHTGVIMKMISENDANEIMNDLEFQNGKWFFNNKDIAKKFANLSLFFTQNFWGAKWNTTMNIHLANALKRALKLKIITPNDLFLTDNVVLDKLLNSSDDAIKLNLQQCEKPLEKMKNIEYKSEKFYPKFRGIDPLVKLKNGKLARLTELDAMFKNYYNEIKQWCKNGYMLDIIIA